MKNLITRSITGFFFVAIMIAGLLFNQYSVSLIFAVIIFFSALEYSNILKKNDTFLLPKWFPIYLLLIFLSSIFNLIFYCNINLVALIPAFLILPFFQELFKLNKDPLKNISLFLLPVVYFVLPFALLIHIAFQPLYEGKIILAFFALIWINDTFAYLFGISLGKHRLYEKVSPKKSWEGFIGGSFSTLVFAFFIPLIFNLQTFNPLTWVIAALTVSICGTLGDLVESLIKRSVDIKDSGSLLPGHGGFLDRFDAAIIAAPFFFAIIYYSKYF